MEVDKRYILAGVSGVKSNLGLIFRCCSAALASVAARGNHSMSHVSKSVHIATVVLFSLVGFSGITDAQIDVRVSGPSPFKPGCDRSGSPAVNYENAEVEPWLAIDPNDADHLV